MDFVVSKVAMSVCALLVVGVLSGALGPQNGDMTAGELYSIASQLCSLVDRTVMSGVEACIIWTVPGLASGEEATVDIRGGVVRAASGDQGSAGQPRYGVHTWTWTGAGLNDSLIRALDGSSRGVRATSGESLVVSTEVVLFDNEPTLLAFARRAV